MKVLIIICVCSILAIVLWQMLVNKKGTVIYRKFKAASIEGNKAGEDANRRMAIYLPPGYDEGTESYPVIYFLHGFNNDEDDLKESKMNELLDDAIASQRIMPVILVMPGSTTKFGGSFYSNSTFTGKWADYIGMDVVGYMDRNFRTIREKNSRGIAGHSMGGNGALKIAMLFPQVFGSVYSLSPSVLDWGKEFTVAHPAFKLIYTTGNLKEISKDIYAHIFLDLARTYSPNEQKPPYFADLPVEFVGDSMFIRDSVVKQWEANFPMRMIDGHLNAIKGWNGFKIDWGRDDWSPHIPFTCKQLSKKLREKGINLEADEYIGGHGDKIGGRDGRINMEVIPFFAKNLSFTTRGILPE